MITFEQARAIATTSGEVLRWFPPGGVEIAEWGSENSRDYVLAGRTPGELWWHEMGEQQLIPGPPMIVVSKATGAVRTFIGATVPDYFDEIGDEDWTPIGDVPD